MNACNFNLRRRTSRWRRTLSLALALGSAICVPPGAVLAAEAETRSRFADASTAYDRIIDEVARRHGVNAALVRAVVKVESNFRADARSPKGALGLMQLLPSTALELGATTLFDPHTNVDAGTRHLKRLLQRYAGSAELALAAYNAGEGAVEKHGRKIPPYPETQSYVRKVLAYFEASSAGAAAPTAAPAGHTARAVGAPAHATPARVTPTVVGGVWTNISNIATHTPHGN